MRAVALALALFAVVALASVELRPRSLELNLETGAGYTFELYKRHFNKNYPERHRHAFHEKVFKENLAKIMAHNSDPTQTWKMGVNQFTDMSEEERKTFLGGRLARKVLMGPRQEAELPAVDFEDLPASVDWRTVTPSIISPVKNQASCGSCWAHGATECIESYTALATGELLTLSRQNLVDCAPNPDHCGGTGGCQGSTAELAFAYVAQNGIATEAAYPYTAKNGQCKTSVSKAARVQSWAVLPTNNYTALVQAVATIGPLAINADASTWHSYSSGVFTGCGFSNIDINHVIQLVGYGTDPATGLDYWLVRNSWSANWGEGGYIRIQKHSDGSSQWCGPDTAPQDGVGCDGGPSQVTVCGSCGIWYDSSYPIGASLV